jgi:hypothetical protein
MDTLIQFITPYTIVVFGGGGIILFLLSNQQRNRADIEWTAWDSVRDLALLVEHCDVPHSALIEKISRVQERFDNRNNDTALLSVLKGIKP